MNRAVVIRAAAGLAAFLAETVGEGFRVVIGCDARYKSAEFAADTAAVVTAAGGVAIQLPEQLPTPLLAFALSHLEADAGVMVTASHNPPADNGYKVYLGKRPLQAIGSEADAEAGAGAQIVSPADALIAEKIAAVESVASAPRAESGWEHLDESIVEDYLSRIDDLGVRAEADLSIVLTSLHGVGAGVAEAALTRTGFTNLHPVASQQAPDPEFRRCHSRTLRRPGHSMSPSACSGDRCRTHHRQRSGCRPVLRGHPGCVSGGRVPAADRRRGGTPPR